MGQRRKSFLVSGKSEQYIVPLLAREINIILSGIQNDFKSDVSVIDIGCGNQPMREMIEANGWKYKSFDVKQNDYDNVDFIGRIDEDIEIKETFKLLLCTEVLEHVLFWEKTFSNFSKLCQPGGKVLITCPFFFPLHEEPYDYWRPTNYSIKEFALRHNFKVIQQHKAGSIGDVLGTLLNSIYMSTNRINVFDKIRARIILWSLNFLRKSLGNGSLEELMTVEGAWYLSNIVLLEKQK